MTTSRDADLAPGGAKWDPLVQHMRAFRASVGDPSYASIAQRIADQRVARGASAYEARIAKSTVHAAFGEGRSRINLALVSEIGEAMGATEADVRQWVAACHEFASEEESTGTNDVAAAPPTAHVLLLLLGCVVLNLLGRVFVDFFHFPFFLDMVGTALAAIALGPWRGAAVGLATNVIGAAFSGWISLPFALVNVAGALIWGYGIRRWRMGTSLPRFFSLNVLVAVGSSAIAVPILLLLAGEKTKGGGGLIVDLVHDVVSAWPVAVTLANLLTSLGDKLISGFVALVILASLPAPWRRQSGVTLLD